MLTFFAGVYIFDIVLVAATRLPNPPAKLARLIERHSSPVTLVQSIATSFTAAVLVLSTLLIGYRAWYASLFLRTVSLIDRTLRIHRLEIRDYVRRCDFGRSLAMLAVLVETGVVYTSLWVSLTSLLSNTWI